MKATVSMKQNERHKIIQEEKTPFLIIRKGCEIPTWRRQPAPGSAPCSPVRVRVRVRSRGKAL